MGKKGTVISGPLAGLKIVVMIACVERVKKNFLRDTHLSAEDDECTPTMKIELDLVRQGCSNNIKAVYAD